MLRMGRAASGALVFALLLGGCGGSDRTVSDGNPLTDDQGASSDDWVIALFEGPSEVGPGSFRGGEVAVSPDAVAQGLSDIEDTYMAEFAERNGGTFSGHCFMVRDESDEGTFLQRVDCGPVDTDAGAATWVKVPIAVRYDGDREPVGFEYLPEFTNLRGVVAGLRSDYSRRLERPDGVRPES